jgi:hypothetical protein
MAINNQLRAPAELLFQLEQLTASNRNAEQRLRDRHRFAEDALTNQLRQLVGAHSTTAAPVPSPPVTPDYISSGIGHGFNEPDNDPESNRSLTPSSDGPINEAGQRPASVVNTAARSYTPLVDPPHTSGVGNAPPANASRDLATGEVVKREEPVALQTPFKPGEVIDLSGSDSDEEPAEKPNREPSTTSEPKPPIKLKVPPGLAKHFRNFGGEPVSPATAFFSGTKEQNQPNANDTTDSSASALFVRFQAKVKKPSAPRSLFMPPPVKTTPSTRTERAVALVAKQAPAKYAPPPSPTFLSRKRASAINMSDSESDSDSGPLSPSPAQKTPKKQRVSFANPPAPRKAAATKTAAFNTTGTRTGSPIAHVRSSLKPMAPPPSPLRSKRAAAASAMGKNREMIVEQDRMRKMSDQELSEELEGRVGLE